MTKKPFAKLRNARRAGLAGQDTNAPRSIAISPPLPPSHAGFQGPDARPPVKVWAPHRSCTRKAPSHASWGVPRSRARRGVGLPPSFAAKSRTYASHASKVTCLQTITPSSFVFIIKQPFQSSLPRFHGHPIRVSSDSSFFSVNDGLRPETTSSVRIQFL